MSHLKKSSSKKPSRKPPSAHRTSILTPGRVIVAFLLFSLILVLGYASKQARSLKQISNAKEYISYFGAGIRVQEDLSVTITEDIVVRNEGGIFKYGIARLLPNVSSQGQKLSFEIDPRFTNIDNILAPPETLQISDTPESYAIYFNAENSLMSAGEHHFTLQYTVKNLIQLKDKRLSFSWNVTGGYWQVPTLNTKVVLNLPRSISPERVNYGAYTEKWSIDGTMPKIEKQTQDFKAIFNSSGEWEFTTTRPLNNWEGFIVSANWPESSEGS